MTAPTPVATYVLGNSTTDAVANVTPSFTPSVGEWITVAATTWDQSVSVTVTDSLASHLTWVKKKEGTTGGFRSYAAVWVAQVTTSVGSMTVSVTPTGSCKHRTTIRRWSAATIAGSPAVNSPADGSGSNVATATLTTIAANSAIVMAIADAQSIDPASRTYSPAGMTEDQIFDGHVNSDSVQYHATLLDAGAAGAKTIGVTLPSGSMGWVMAAIEVQGSAGGSILTAAADFSATGTMTAAAVVIKLGAASLSAVATLSPTGMTIALGSATLSAHGDLSAAGSVFKLGAAALTAHGDMTVAGTTIKLGAATLSAHGDLSAGALAIGLAGAALSAHGDLSATAMGILLGSVSLSAHGDLVASAGGTITAGASLSASGFLVAAATILGETARRVGLSMDELKYQRIQTEAFIASNPVYLILIPRTRLMTGGGIKLIPGTPRAQQKLRIIDQTRTFGPEPGSLMGADGRQRKLRYQLLGLWDAEIGLYDYWVDDDGVLWEIADLLPDMGYERRAQVVRYGES